MRVRAIRALVALLWVGAQVATAGGAHATAHHTAVRAGRGESRNPMAERLRAGGSRLWVARAPGGEGDGLAVSPAGDVVYVTGETEQGCTTIAYAGATGHRLWQAVFTEGGMEGRAIAVSPNGKVVFVTGEADAKVGSGTNFEYVTIAYDASSAKRLWVARYNGPLTNGFDQPAAIGVSPGGKRLFVTGWSEGRNGPDVATLAYDASSGKRVWVARYDGPVKGTDKAFAIAVNPAGTRVFVTGESEGNHIASGLDSLLDYVTIAYGAPTGARVWVARYNGPVNLADGASALAVSPNGDTVFVTGGESVRSTGFRDYATIAYGSSTGVRRWVARYNGPGNKNDFATALAVNHSGTRVFVTGFSEGKNSSAAFGTVAYGTASGARVWVARYVGPANLSAATAIAIRPDGSQVYVTGPSRGTAKPLFPNPADYATVAYGASTGTKLWVSRYGRAGLRNVPVAIGVASGGTHVFVTGMSQPDFTTVAYAT